MDVIMCQQVLVSSWLHPHILHIITLKKIWQNNHNARKPARNNLLRNSSRRNPKKPLPLLCAAPSQKKACSASAAAN